MQEQQDNFVHDQKLLEEYRAGDKRAYGELYKKYQRIATGYAQRYCSGTDEAEDVANEAFERIMVAISRGNGPTVSMGHYLLTTIRSVAFKRHKLTAQEDVFDPAVIADLCESVSTAQETPVAAWLTEAFNSLSERKQQIVWMHTVEGIRLKVIAEQLGISAPSVTRAHQRAMREMRRAFVDEAMKVRSDPKCHAEVPRLYEVADGAVRQTSEHVSNCRHCSLVFNKLCEGERRVLVAVLVAGLGSAGASSLLVQTDSMAAAAVPPPLASNLAAAFGSSGMWPFIAGVPLIALVVVGTSFLNVQSTTGPPAGPREESSVVLGQGDNKAIAYVNDCELTREVVSDRRELWRLTPDQSCQAKVSAQFKGTGVQEMLLDTSSQQSVRRYLEVTRPGAYEVTLTNKGEETSVVLQLTIS